MEGQVSRFNLCLDSVLRHEGGFVNHPQDPGGPTNMGVTLKAWEEFTGKPATLDDIRNLTSHAVTDFYREKYWQAVQADRMPVGVDLCLFDFAVNSGPPRAIRCLQRVVGVPVDGIVGPVTRGATHSTNPVDIINEMCDSRLGFLQSLPTWQTFGKGWERRVKAIRKECLKWVSSSDSR